MHSQKSLFNAFTFRGRVPFILTLLNAKKVNTFGADRPGSAGSDPGSGDTGQGPPQESSFAPAGFALFDLFIQSTFIVHLVLRQDNCSLSPGCFNLEPPPLSRGLETAESWILFSCSISALNSGRAPAKGVGICV